MLGLAPEREGQPRTYTATGPVPEAGHWYSPAAVREMLAEERERCAAWLEAQGRHDMAFGIRRGMHRVDRGA